MRALHIPRVSRAGRVGATVLALGTPALALAAASQPSHHSSNHNALALSAQATPSTNASRSTSVDSANQATAAFVGLEKSHAADRVVAHQRRHLRRHVTPQIALTPSVASWYYDAGDTACGFHAHFGVANKTLPCGTKVEIKYGSRTVTATVDDRGPYVEGRSYDLSQTTAAALGMSGVETVLVSR